MEKTKINDKSTILLVDDVKANNHALEELLQRDDRIFIKASSGNEALKIALSRNIDLIILDVKMPDMDGFEVAQFLNSHKRTRDIPVIFASAENKENKFIMKGLEEGAIDYLYKPLDPEITRAKVSIHLKLHKQKKELIEKNISLERYALLINNSADIIAVVDVNTMKFEEVNSAFTNILGYTSEEVFGAPLELFLSDEDRELVHELRNEQREKLSFETKMYSKNRDIKWLQWNVIVKEKKWFVNARDVTLVKQVEKIRDYLATVVKQSGDAVYIYNENKRIISWNQGAEKIYGYQEQEALKMKIWNLIPEFLQEEMQALMDKLRQKKPLRSVETQRVTKKGKLIDVLFSASVITDPENSKQSIAITERDITQQKIAEKQIMKLNSDLELNVIQLETANKELESFSYSVSHDLRAPLRALHGYANIFEEDYLGNMDEGAREVMSHIRRNAFRMGELINSLLDFSRTSKQEIKKSKINMAALVKEVTEELKVETPNRADIKIGPLPPVFADSALIRQVWVNLISNAIKYSGKKSKPTIEISSYPNDKETIFRVHDNGVGFNMEYVDKLFGVFQRLHSPKEFEGTGIGLAITNRIVTRHGGKVWAESEVGKGATFYFSLPEVSELIEA